MRGSARGSFARELALDRPAESEAGHLPHFPAAVVWNGRLRARRSARPETLRLRPRIAPRRDVDHMVVEVLGALGLESDASEAATAIELALRADKAPP